MNQRIRQLEAAVWQRHRPRAARLALVSLTTVALIVLAACGKSPAADAKDATVGAVARVGVIKVGRKTLDRRLTVSSELVPFQETDLYAKESGFVKTLLVDYGSRVRKGQLMAVLSLDEKPGIQAIGKVAPDLPPVPGKHPSNGRDYEYKRHGTLSLLAGLDLLTGKVHACIEERHRSLEFTKLLEQIHQAYSAETRILIVLSLDALVCAAGTGGQPFSPHLEGNPGLPQDAAQPIRVRVHTQTRVLV